MANDKKPAIAGVVVTYNRIDLLKECLKALLGQTFGLSKVYVINNKSTDGTADYLHTLSADDRFCVIDLPENIGGAGGFCEGIKESVLGKYDWVWVMDDDTVPDSSALEELVKAATAINHVGYVCSRAVWTDGMLHKMNIPDFCSGWGNGIPLNYYTYAADALLVRSASFVSLLINTKAVKEVGLPISEFFIWGDDLEYTQRIYNAGWTCLYADKSRVVHKTENNYVSDIRTASDKVAWKFYYGVRNSNYMRRRGKSKIGYFFYVLNNYRLNCRRVKKRTDIDKKAFLEILKKALRDSFSFNPEIRYLD